MLRVRARVGVIESGDESERDDVIFAAIDPGAAVLAARQRPTHRVDDLPAADASRRDFP